MAHASSKYLFAGNIIIDGERVAIKEVSNFQNTDNNAINICFTTISFDQLAQEIKEEFSAAHCISAKGNYNIFEINEALFAFDQSLLGA